MSTSHAGHAVVSRPDPPAHPEMRPRSYATAGALLWLAGGAVLFFLVPFVGTDVLGLQPDLSTSPSRWPGSAPSLPPT
jgi:hypothetical protein